MQELISVVIPVYNCGPYLDDCLNSLVAQTWQNWEAILVDDGSTDDSPAKCDAWAKRDPRVWVIHQQNQGVSAARNAGIDAAKGKYLAFVDADDWVEPEYLAILHRILGNTQLAICCVYDTSDWNEKVWDEVVSLQTLRTTPSRYANPVYINYPCNKLFLTEIIQENQLRFPEHVRRCEDAYFVQDYLLCCREISVTAKKLYRYVQRDGSAMHSFYEGVCDDEIPLMQRQYELFHGQPLTDTEEQAYRLWEWGKVLAILRYIARYAPKGKERNSQLQKLRSSTINRVSQESRILKKRIGIKAKLACLLFRGSQYSLLCVLLNRS